MAEQLSLVKGYDFEADQGTVVLIGGTADGFDVAYQGWTPNTTPDKKGVIQEALTLRVQGTSTDNIATSLQKLADKAEETQRYFANGARDYAVWFRVQLKDETKGRQSLVYAIQHEPASSVYDYALRQAYHWNKYTLGITRASWWEGTACGTITIGTVELVGGTSVFSGTIHGDLDGRWAQVKISKTEATDSGSAIFPYGKAWIGYKSSAYGNAGSFVSYWSITNPASTAHIVTLGGMGTATADALAKSGTALVITQAASAGYLRFTRGLQLRAVTTDTSVLRGDHMVLARARINGAGTTTWLMRMQAGWKDDYEVYAIGDTGKTYYPHAITYPRVSIMYNESNTNNQYKYYEMGKVTFPPSKIFKSQYDLDTYALLLSTQCVEGTANLHVDGFVLIPMDGYVYVGADKEMGTYGTVVTYAVNSPDGVQDAVSTQSIGGTAHPYGMNMPVFAGGMPPGTAGAFFVAAQSNEYGGSINNTLAIEIKYFERWKEARGND